MLSQHGIMLPVFVLTEILYLHIYERMMHLCVRYSLTKCSLTKLHPGNCQHELSDSGHNPVEVALYTQEIM